MLLGWFFLLALLAVTGLRLGHRVGHGSDYRAWITLVMAIMLLSFWTWLQHHPGIAVRIIPVQLLSYIEGVASVPVFLFIIGVAWARARLTHQKRLTVLAACLGGVFFLQGGMWMLQTTPSSALGDQQGNLVMQSQDFSCVPAACATALNRLGVRTSEAEMAELTFTRPGTGATLIRAAGGLRERLAGTDFTVQIVDATVDQLSALSTPMITPLRLESSQFHMVVIADAHPRYGMLIIDPTNGPMQFSLKEFAEVYSGSVIHFESR